MGKPSDRIDSEQVERLESEHRDLKRQVAELGRRAHLTPSEQRLVVELKKRKLATKDALIAQRTR